MQQLKTNEIEIFNMEFNMPHSPDIILSCQSPVVRQWIWHM